MPKMDEAVAAAIREMDAQEGTVALTDAVVVTLNKFTHDQEWYAVALTQLVREERNIYNQYRLAEAIVEAERAVRPISEEEFPVLVELARREYVPLVVDYMKAAGCYFAPEVEIPETGEKLVAIFRSRREFQRLRNPNASKSQVKKRPKKTYGKRK